MTSVVSNGLDLVLFFIPHEVGGRPAIVFSVFFCLDERGKERRVEDRVDGPLGGQCEFVRHGRYHLCDFKRAVTSGGKFHRSIRQG
jgi:hypothetical protein